MPAHHPGVRPFTVRRLPLTLASALALAIAVGGCSVELRAEEPPAVTDLASLVDTARSRHPTAVAVKAALRAAEARASQAGTWANPEVEVSYGRTSPRVADLASDRPYGGRIAQRIEWWGKRSARVAAATAQVSAAAAESAAAHLDLETEVRLAAIALADARMAEEQAGREVALAQELVDVVDKRQALGDSDRGEAARARLEATTARLRHEASGRQVALQLALLRGWCGETLPDSLIVSDALTDPLADGEGRAAVGTHPRIRAALEAERAAEARIDAERQARLPDMTVGVFGDREREKDTYGVTLGFEVPLWDRNSARIAEAEAERAQFAAQRAVAAQGLERERAVALGALRSAAAEVIVLRDQALPVAEEMVELRMAAFRAGDAGLADVLESRRAALAVQTGLLDARRRHAEALVRLRAVSPLEVRP